MRQKKAYNGFKRDFFKNKAKKVVIPDSYRGSSDAPKAFGVLTQCFEKRSKNTVGLLLTHYLKTTEL